MTDTLHQPVTIPPAQDVDGEPITLGDALRILARHIDDQDLTDPITITPADWGYSTKVVVSNAEYAAWSTSLPRWTGETSITWRDRQIVTALGSIGRLPVQLVTVRDLDEQPAEV